MTGQVDEAGRERDLIHADLTDLVNALGMGDHARPYSSHQLMQEAIGNVRVLADQVAAIRALLAEIEATTSECGEWWIAREMGRERPERQHYPDEGWSFCDGCSAAQAGDYDSKAIVARIRAALVASSPTTPEAKK